MLERAKETLRWIRVRRPPWHYLMRAVALAEFIDQLAGPLTAAPSSEGIIIACLGAMFAPVPKSRRDGEEK